jgi:hypothetical protein
MWSFLTSIWNGIKSFFSVILPFGQGRSFRGLSSAVRWTLHVIILVLVLVGLFILNQLFDVGRFTPTPIRPLAHLWLPMFFLLLYVLAWIGWWIWKLLSQEEQAGEFPDIDEAWDEAMRALQENGIRVTELPLFLVLGRPEGSEGVETAHKPGKAEETLFRATNLKLVVKQTPSALKAPVRVYATHDAVYVTCAGASLMGRQAAILAGEADLRRLEEAGDPTENMDPFESYGMATLRPGSREKKVVGLLARTRGRELSGREKRALRKQAGFRLTELAGNDHETERQTARLQHLCRLILRDRKPYCPMNGIMMLVPFAATDSEAEAEQTAELCRRDMMTLRRTLRVHCPVFALVCDLETTLGFREFIKRLRPEDRQRRIGQRFPLAANVNGDALLNKVDTAVEWLSNNLVREWVYKLFRVESAAGESYDPIVTGNARLYEMLNEMRERHPRLSAILKRALEAEADGNLLFGGCYIAATGSDPAFVAGVFQRLIDHQNAVTWSDGAFEDDARSHRLTTIGYTVLIVVGLAILVLAGYWIFGRGGRR